MVRPCWGAQQHEEAQRGWWWLCAGRALAALSQELPWEPTEDAHRVQSRGAWYWYLRPCMASSLQLCPRFALSHLWPCSEQALSWGCSSGICVLLIALIGSPWPCWS